MGVLFGIYRVLLREFVSDRKLTDMLKCYFIIYNRPDVSHPVGPLNLTAKLKDAVHT